MGVYAALRAPTALSRRWFLLGLFTLVIVVSIQYSLKTAEERSAFVRWQTQLHALGEGEDIYQLYVYPNAPMMALILYPLSLLPRVSIFEFDIYFGAQCWFFLKLGMTVLAFVWAFRLIQEEARPFPSWAQAATLLLSLRPIIGDLTHGNVNLLILFLIVASLYAFKQRRDVLAGLVLALAITCKVTPALFFPYFLWKRAWRTALACLAGLTLFFFVIPGMVLGPAHNWRLLGSWLEKMILPYTMSGEVTTEHCNQSLPGLIYRLGTASPSFLDHEDRPSEYHNVADLHPAVARGLVLGSGLAFAALVCGCCRTSIVSRDRWQLAAEYSIIVLGMLLFSERTWKHHCVTLLLPFGVLCYYLAVMRPRASGSMNQESGVSKKYVIGSIAAAVLLIASTSTGLWEVFGYRLGAKMAQVYGAYAWAELALLAALVAILAKAPDRASALCNSSRTV